MNDTSNTSDTDLDAYVPCLARTVKPRKLAKPCTRKIIVIDPSGYVYSEHGEYASLNEYIRTVLFLSPHIVVCYSPETWLYKLHMYWSGHSQWSWRVAVTDKHGRALQVKRVAYYGFRDPVKRSNRYHVVLDAGSFFRKQDRNVPDLLKLGRDVRTFCNQHGLELRASAAGIAGQLLRHPAFYPFARRRVPHFINEAVRPHLPGGFYESYTGAGQRIDAAMYVDQESAHHFATESTPLPNANSVRAIGYARCDRRYARRDGELYAREMRKHGLVKAYVSIPPLVRRDYNFVPRLMQSPGEGVAYIWTNELPYLESLGLEVRYLIAIWGSEEVDKGIAKYAQWARQVQRQFPALKALLLMPYGLLARRRSNVTYHHPGGHSPLILANQLLDDTKASRQIETQPDTANALQLGLIQAFVRTLSLDMARQLSAHNHRVVSIYADGIFVKLTEGKPIPLFDPWRVKEECTLELRESLRAPVRARVRWEYVETRRDHDVTKAN